VDSYARVITVVGYDMENPGLGDQEKSKLEEDEKSACFTNAELN